MNNDDKPKMIQLKKDTLKGLKYKVKPFIPFDEIERQADFNRFLECIVLNDIQSFFNDNIELILPGKTYEFNCGKTFKKIISYEHMEKELTFLNLLKKLFNMKIKKNKVIKEIQVNFNIAGKVNIIFPDSTAAAILRSNKDTFRESILIRKPFADADYKNFENEVETMLFSRMWVDKDIQIEITNISII